MSIAASKKDASSSTAFLRGFSAPVILVVGVILVPILLAVAANSWSTPNDADYVRMAFANVAGSTIAIVTVVALLLNRIIRRAPASTIAILSLIAAAVVLWQFSQMGGAAELLLRRLAG